jgi:MinD-like ATPase involved in chromosome partitioning or flagellar assembly
MSPVPGTGRTTVTGLLGTLMALLRRDRIIAVDPSAGATSLSGALAPGHQSAAPGVLEALAGRELNLTQLDSRLGRAPHGLMVLPVAGGVQACRTAVERLRRFAGVVLLDCPADLDEAGREAAVDLADQVLLVCDDQPTTAAAVTEAGVALSRGGHPVLIVVNKVPRRGGRIDLGRLAAGLHEADGMVVVPDSPAGAARLLTGRFDWRDAPREWRVAVRELAAALVADWPRLGLSG